ncbi:sucrase ferredoxin [Litorilinea aerophila]|uniref:Sucrase ferredoxin n=1 Tax=Litorilinea aerophila TaxID=1204385 RepID=A0A540VGD3_9CHLR|nr:sucrase ferredoxin [Litorilinea aerophila]
METIITDSPSPYCSHVSRAVGEQIFGTAARNTRVWLALEYPRPWGAKALEESDLPAPVKERLVHLQAHVPGCRLQFIKQQANGAAAPSGIRCFVGLSREQRSQLYQIRLQEYGELLSLDLAALAAGEPVAGAEAVPGPLFLVCTNGRRDRCCAKFGLPVYQAMAHHAGAAVWQTTHTGGHRFAATLIALPDGVCYGWLTPEDAVPLVEAHRREQIYRLDRYRGRSCYGPVVQAADYFLRRETGLLGLADLRLVDCQPAPDEPDVWTVRFVTATDGARHQLRLRQELSPFELALSCGKEEAEAVPQHRLLAWDVENPRSA